jgi:hypothetical protein
LAISTVILSSPFVPLFLLAKKAQKKKLGKKKYAVRRFRVLRNATKASPLETTNFLKKVCQKLSAQGLIKL